MKTNRIVLYGLYLAIFFFMALTPYIGFIKVGVVSITTMLIPVIVMSWHLKWKGAIVAGFYFGITSFVYAIVYGAPIVGLIGIGKTFIVATLTRIIFGLIIAIIVYGLEKLKISNFIKVLILSISSLAINHLLFLGMYAIFLEEGFVWIFTVVSINTAIEWPVVIFMSLAMIPLFKKLDSDSYLGY